MTMWLPLGLFALFLVVALVRSEIVARRLSGLSWEELVASLEPVRLDGLMRAASGVSPVSTILCHATVEETLMLIGGRCGLERLKQNADVLVALASYSELWSPEMSESAVVKMRKDGLKLKRAALTLRLALLFKLPNAFGMLAVRDASAAYCRMVTQLVTLYQSAHVGRRPVLAAACCL